MVGRGTSALFRQARFCGREPRPGPLARDNTGDNRYMFDQTDPALIAKLDKYKKYRIFGKFVKIGLFFWYSRITHAYRDL